MRPHNNTNQQRVGAHCPPKPGPTTSPGKSAGAAAGGPGRWGTMRAEDPAGLQARARRCRKLTTQRLPTPMAVSRFGIDPPWLSLDLASHSRPYGGVRTATDTPHHGPKPGSAPRRAPPT